MPEQKEPAFHIHPLPNGVTLLGEDMDSVSSAAFSISVPIGAATDPNGKDGSSSILGEMLNKGAGPWNAKELSEQFENIGARRSHSSGIEVSIFSGVLLGENLQKALELSSVMLLNPTLPEDELESVRELSLQELLSLEDEPSSKVMVELAKRFYPHPFGRCQLGTEDGVKAVSMESLRDYYSKQFLAQDAIIAVAGKFDWEQLRDSVASHFGSWKGRKPSLDVPALAKESSTYHIERDTSQLQIALASPSVCFDHPDYYVSKVAIGVLSGGMCGRLFVEVREKRGLVYRIGASQSAARGRAAVFCYAGTTPENGQETLDVMLKELRGIGSGVSDEELRRAKADLKSRVIMQSELSSVRSSALVNDWWNLGRTRTLSEIEAAIDAVTSADISRHLEEFPFSPITMLTLGPAALELAE